MMGVGERDGVGSLFTLRTSKLQHQQKRFVSNQFITKQKRLPTPWLCPPSLSLVFQISCFQQRHAYANDVEVVKAARVCIAVACSKLLQTA